MADFQGYTSPYGWRVHPISGERKMHYGLDIGADEGKELRNWWTGKVIKVVQNPSSGCGNEITVQSGSWESRSCHLQKTLVEEGQQVKSGDIIGLVGQTGGVTGPHLHWELYYKGDILNPGEVIVAMQKAKTGDQTPAAPEATKTSYLRHDESNAVYP
jgi:murein DD-endopeptidase MepM/ murein hydrolase activator NlpD